MPQPSIRVTDLTKSYFVPERQQGLLSAIKSLVKRKTKEVKAVNNVNFTIQPGEIVGFLGPNGAGKTTTLKMLSGLLYPTSGVAEVLGHIPEKREKKFLKRITLIMGNRNQLQWDIPALDSFELNRAIFGVPKEEFKEFRDKLIKMLDIKDLVHKPIRNLSLGERMKMEIVGSLLHRPEVLFLDEPTIGLDVTMQKRLRNFIAEYNKLTGATIILTSHYMADVTALCKRIIVIHHGAIHFDGTLNQLVKMFTPYKTVIFTFDKPEDISNYGEIVKTEENGEKVSLRVAQTNVSDTTAKILQDFTVLDLNVEDTPIDDVIEKIFALEKVEP